MALTHFPKKGKPAPKPVTGGGSKIKASTKTKTAPAKKASKPVGKREGKKMAEDYGIPKEAVLGSKAPKS